MGHLDLHIRALIATTEPRNCPRESLFCPSWGVVKRRHKLGKGAPVLHALIHGAFSPSHYSTFIGTVEPGKLSQLIIFALIMGHSFMENTQSGQIPGGRGTFIPK